MTDQQQTLSSESGVDATEAWIVENRGWFIALGLLLVIVGLFSIGAPLATTIIVKSFLGWLLLISGVAQIGHAFFAQGWKGFFGNLVSGVLYTVVGIWLAFFPLAGIIGLTLLLALTFFVEGLFKFQIGVQIRPASGWLWMIISGFIAIGAGILLIAGLPSTAIWAIGLIVGVNLLMSGVAFILLAIGARKSA